MHTGETTLSTVRRPSAHRAYLREVSRQTTVLHLQGFIFFGTITRVEETIRALVSEPDFVTVQGTRAVREDAKHCCRLSGLLRCTLCDRTFEGHWANHRAGYRCRHGHTSAHAPTLDRPKNIYVRQDTAMAYAAAELGIPHGRPEQVTDRLRATDTIIICMPTGMLIRQEARA